MPHPSVTAETLPHKPAIIMGGSGEIVTYRELDERSNQGAQLLRGLGLQAGDHLALMLENRREFLEICFACQRSGIVYTPISTQLEEEEMRYILANCGARVFISSPALLPVAGRMLDGAEGPRHCFLVGGIAEGFESWEEAVDRQPAERIGDETRGVELLYSAGTTGRPKGVSIPPPCDDPYAEDPLAVSLGAAFGFGAETVYLSPAPLYNAAPLRYTLAVLFRGGTGVVMEHFEPEEALRLVEAYRCTHSQWVPIMFIRMLRLPPEVRDRYDLSSMQYAIHAAAPCPIEVKEQMIDWWGPVLVEYYAASEAIGMTLIDSDAWLSHKGSVGPAVLGELHIVDDAGHELPPGEIGTVYFSGEQTGFRYHEEAEKTAEAFNERGWATTGDVGYVDEDGFLYLTDRTHFTINRDGVNVYPQAVENALIGHDKVADVAVFGVPDDEFGETVTAVVEPVNWVDATDEVAIELMEWLRERVAHLQVPKALHFREKLPRRDDGKLYKRHLAEEFRGGARADDGPRAGDGG